MSKLKIYNYCDGLDTYLGDLVVGTIYFKTLSPALLDLVTKSNRYSLSLAEEILTHSDDFVFDYKICKHSSVLTTARAVKSAVQFLSLMIGLKQQVSSKDIHVIHNQDIPRSLDLTTTVLHNRKPTPELLICQTLTGYYRYQHLKKFDLKWPEYKILKHLGKMTRLHMELILEHRVHSKHHYLTMQAVADYMYRFIKEKSTKKFNWIPYDNKLPSWWRVNEETLRGYEVKTLTDYYSDEQRQKVKDIRKEMAIKAQRRGKYKRKYKYHVITNYI